MEKKLYILTIVLIGLVAVNVFFVFKSPRQDEGLANSEFISSSQAYLLPVSEPNYLPVLVSNGEKPVLDAKSSAVYDTRLGRFLFAQNTRTRLPIASLTKLMSALLIVEKLNMDDIVKISSSSIRVDGEKRTLYENEEITVLSLLKLMLIESSNDASYALTNYFKNITGADLVEQMNERARAYQMTETKFLDPAGLNDEAFSTVEDLIKLVRNALKQSLIWDVMTQKSTSVSSVDGKIKHSIENTNQLFGVIPDVVGGKTGYTEGALGCMILVVDIPGKNDKIISVVLGSRERFNDTQKLIDWVKSSYSWE